MLERSDKVWGGITFVGSKQVRTLVIAKTQKQAAARVGDSLHSFRQYWSETGNAVELEVCRRTDGHVFKATTCNGVDFSAVPPHKVLP